MKKKVLLQFAQPSLHLQKKILERYLKRHHDTPHNDIQPNGIRHYKKNVTLSILTLATKCCHTEWQLCWMFLSSLCRMSLSRVSLCRMSLCRVSLCWMSWRHLKPLNAHCSNFFFSFLIGSNCEFFVFFDKIGKKIWNFLSIFSKPEMYFLL